MGIALEWTAATVAFGSHVRNAMRSPSGVGRQIPAKAGQHRISANNQNGHCRMNILRPKDALGYANDPTPA